MDNLRPNLVWSINILPISIHVLQNADPIAGTLPHFSQDLYQAVYFATDIANQYGHTPGATKIQA